MNLTTDKVTEIFYLTDEFCKALKTSASQYAMGKPSKRPPIMSDSEVITLMTLFHTGSFRCMKHFYVHFVQKHMQSEFPNTVSYNRFVELTKAAVFPMAMFLKLCCMGSCTGISYIDSTTIRVCKNNRIPSNKVFRDTATRGSSSMGYFFGFKLHIIINDKGEILNFSITQGNVDDREPLKNKNFTKVIHGKIFGDKGYLSKSMTEELFMGGIHLFTNIRNNMKNSLMQLKDKILLRKRSVIETVNDELKNICQIEHSRHRSFGNFITNILSGLIAYSFFPKKPAIKFETVKSNQITIF